MFELIPFEINHPESIAYDVWRDLYFNFRSLIVLEKYHTHKNQRMSASLYNQIYAHNLNRLL